MTIMIIGETWGEDEAREQRAFVGSAGKLLKATLRQVGIDPNTCLYTNVFNLRPESGNDVANLCGPKETGIPGLPSIAPGKYVRQEFAPEIARLYREIEAAKPTLIIALGGAVTWALFGQAGIKKVRGTAAMSVKPIACKVIPTYHPSTILRQYALYPVFALDLSKAASESAFPEVRRPSRKIYIAEKFSDLIDFEIEYINKCEYLSVDVETAKTQITLLGMAPNPECALLIPFTDDTKAEHNYWPTLEEEVQVWKWIRRTLTRYPTFGQNFNYDIKFIWQTYGIPLPKAAHDIMLLHHALQPEMEKSLGFMASLYTQELSWKFMRPKHNPKKGDLK